MSSELLLMLLADARLPVAGHTQSAGLEPAVADGVTDVPSYLRLRLDTVTRVEAATAVVALHHLRAGLPLDAVETAWAARTPSPAMRAASRAMGRALLRLATRLWSVETGPVAPRAIALAVCADRCGLAPASLARLVGYDDVQTVCSAALKLLPLDPTDTTRWALESLPAVERIATEVAALTDPDDIPAAGAPQLEVWAEAHAVTTRRLFSA